MPGAPTPRPPADRAASRARPAPRPRRRAGASPGWRGRRGACSRPACRGPRRAGRAAASPPRARARGRRPTRRGRGAPRRCRSRRGARAVRRRAGASRAADACAGRTRDPSGASAARSWERVNRLQDLAGGGTDAIGVGSVDPADHGLLVEEEGRRQEEIAAPAVGRPMGDEGGRHAVTMPDVERVHERSALVGEEADREADLPAELLRDVERIDAHRDHLDAPVEDVPVVLAELAELRHAERSPVTPVAEDEEAAAAGGGEAEGRAVGGGQREVGETLANSWPVLARAVHREGEEKPAREHEDADGAERARRQAADRLGGLALTEAGALLAADDERGHGEVLEKAEAVGQGRIRVDLGLDLTRAEELHLAVGTVRHAVVDIEVDELLLPGLEGHAAPERGEHGLAARPHVAPPARGGGERVLPRGLLQAGSRDEHRLDQDGAREAPRPGRSRRRDRGGALGVPDGPHAVQPERIEEALQVGAERVPAVARRRLVALAVAALIEGEDAVARGEAARIGQPEPGVEAGRVEEEERRAIPAEVEVVEAEVADADVAVGGLGLARHRSALSRAPELCQNAGTEATKRAWTSRSRRPSSPSPKRRAPGSRRTCRPPGAATTAGRAPMTRSGSGSRATGSGSSTRAAGRRSPGRASTAAGARRSSSAGSSRRRSIARARPGPPPAPTST